MWISSGTDRLSVWLAWRTALWRAQFKFLFHGAGLVVWWDHGRALRGCGISRQMFEEKTGRAGRSFLGSLNSGGAKWRGIKAGSGSTVQA